MSRTIYKYPVMVSADFRVEIPQAHKVLRVAPQKTSATTEAPFMWVDVDTDSPVYEFDFCTAGTGHPRPSGYQYQGTWDEQNGLFVWHLFEQCSIRLELPDTF